MSSKVNEIKARAKNLGFSFVGFTDVKQTPHFSEYLNWLEEDKNGQLEFLKKEYVIESRRDPGLLLKGAKSVIVLGVNYQRNPADQKINSKHNGTIAAYAQYDDYHHVLKSKAKALIESINNGGNRKLNYRIFIDSGPLMEKDFAFSAGKGWIGRNSLFIHPDFGSFIFLCCAMIDKHLIEDAGKPVDLCGDCHLCEESCPTQCINGDHTINASKCISYLTIEHKGVIPENLRSTIGNYIFGCDICQEICPYNTRKKRPPESNYFNLKKKYLHSVDLYKEFSLTEKDFYKKFFNTPITRIPYEQYLRNIIISAGNSCHIKYIEPLKNLLSSDSEVIRTHVVWALGKIGSHRCFNI